MALITLPVHRLTRRTIISEFGSDTIHVDMASPLLPHLICKRIGKKTELNDHITITGDASIVAAIRKDAGHNLYMAHMHQLIQWIARHVDLDDNAWTSMMQYYAAVGLDIDDLPPERVYKRWQRWSKQKKADLYLYKSQSDVLKNTNDKIGGLNDALKTASGVIHRNPDIFYWADGVPDPVMIKKGIIYVMAVEHQWSQQEIASHFGITQQCVSFHMRSFRDIYYPVAFVKER